jgi:tRNA A-37 threonylcarbamoyl transferase component Bud32
MKEQQGIVSEGQNLRRFGNYDLVRRIDMGGMGEVYLARQRTAFGREVAVKIIRSDLVHDITARKRFLREAEVSAHIKHEHILPLVEFGEEQGRLFLVTPYIEGGTLVRRLQDGPLSLAEVSQVFTALVQAVAYIHRRGVIHRDLKPSNIMLDREEEGSDEIYVRLIDFGIASIQGAAASPPLTEAGTEVGTVVYMAPERLNGIAAPSNDIYSLGVILYQMLVGHLPRKGEQARLPLQLEGIVRRCTAVQVEQRFTTADDLLRAFKQACEVLDAPMQKQTAEQFVAQLAAPKVAQPVAAEAVGADDKGEAPTVRRVPSHRLRDYAASEASSATQAEVVLQQAANANAFHDDDYDAPTASIDPAAFATAQSQHLSQDAVYTRAPALARQPHSSKRSLLALIPISIVVVVLLIAATALFAFQTAVTGRVTVTPQVKAVSKVFTITARADITSVDANTASIPLSKLPLTKQGSRTENTTGTDLVCSIFMPRSKCSKVVSDGDVYKTGIDLKQDLKAQLQQDMNNQLHAKNATALGDPTFTDVPNSFSYTPSVGSKSDSVTANLTEQATVSYYSNNDIQGLVRQMLTQQAGAKYELIPTSIQVGTASSKSVDPTTGALTLSVPAAGVAKYQLTDSDLQNIQERVRGMKLKDARTFIEKQAGIDPKALVVSVSVGDSMPGDVRQIKVAQAAPTNIPVVQLPKV